MKFHCTYCGHSIHAVGPAGTGMTCSGCEAQVTVPEFKTERAVSRPPKPVAAKLVPRTSVLRRVFLFTLVGCFAIGAVTGIFVLQSQELGELQARVLITTLSLGFYSITGLCCAALGERTQFGAFAKLGIAASALGAVFAVLNNWGIITGLATTLKSRFSHIVVATAFAHAALLLLIPTTNTLVRAVRGLTVVLVAAVAAFLLALTLGVEFSAGTGTVLTSLIIVNVLGTLSTPLLHMATRRTERM